MNAAMPTQPMPDPCDGHEPADVSAATLSSSIVPGDSPVAESGDEDDGYEPV